MPGARKRTASHAGDELRGPLTETAIAAIRHDPTKQRWSNDSPGLYLRVLPSGRKAWVWRVKRGGKTTWTHLGEWPLMSVKHARLERDKRAGRATPPNSLLVRDALEEWFADKIAPRYRSTKNVRVYVDRAKVAFGHRRLQELRREEIARFVRMYARETPVAANRCLSTIKLALGWAVEVGYLETNPAEAISRDSAGGDEASRKRVLNDAEIREIWHHPSENARLMRALLLTGCRIRELQLASSANIFRGGSKIDEFRRDPDGDWLMLPGSITKNKRAHFVYLMPETRAQFDGAPPLLFRAVSSTGVQAWVRRLQMDVDGDDSPREPWGSIRPMDTETGEPFPYWTPHDLRRTFYSRLMGLGVAPHVVGKLVNHTPEGMAAIYNQAELLAERIEATKLWAAELAKIVGPRPKGA